MEQERHAEQGSQRFVYPAVLDLHDVLVLVVGAGPVGARKVAGLARAGARVRLVATEVDACIDLGSVSEVRERDFTPNDLDGARLVITATGVRDVDTAVAAAARSRGIWVNAADRRDDCDFILPAVHRAGRVTAAISTDGASPALAGWLRDRVAELLTEEVAALADRLADQRAQLHAAGESTEGIDWIEQIESVLTTTGAVPTAPAGRSTRTIESSCENPSRTLAG